MSKAAGLPTGKKIMRDISSSIGAEQTLGKWQRLTVATAAFAALLFLSGCATGVKNTSRTYRTVVIDAGHGGHDSGARARSGMKEKEAALDVALRLEPKLRAAGFQTKMTRKRDVFIPLDQRVRASNRASNSIFVSIHFNHAKAARVRGAEVYYRSQASREIASRVLDRLYEVPGTARRGLKTANFRVLRLNRYPAVLVECGFMSNPTEAARAASPAYREQLADAIADALVEQRFGAAGLAKLRPRTTPEAPPFRLAATPTPSPRAASAPRSPSGQRAL
jgi:N-acetylmuramoyl-L-alanine amidase